MKTGNKCVVIFGSNYPNELPDDSDIQCLLFVSSQEFLVLLNQAKGRVIGAGGTLLQSIELAKPSVSIAVSKDQPSRLEDCMSKNYTIGASLDANDICSCIEKLSETQNFRSMVKSIQERTQEHGLKTALIDIEQLLSL